MLLLHVRCRHVPAALAAVVGGTALLWALAAAVDDPRADRTLGLSAAVVGAAAAGHGLAGPDVDLDRTAAIRWPLWRAAHIALVVAASLALIAATGLTGHPLGKVALAARNVAGAGGLLALAATALGASRAWIPVVLWVMAAPQALGQLDLVPGWPSFLQVLAWPGQPAASAPAAIAAIALALAGTATYALHGPGS